MLSVSINFFTLHNGMMFNSVNGIAIKAKVVDLKQDELDH